MRVFSSSYTFLSKDQNKDIAIGTFPSNLVGRDCHVDGDGIIDGVEEDVMDARVDGVNVPYVYCDMYAIVDCFGSAPTNVVMLSCSDGDIDVIIDEARDGIMD